MFGRHTRKRVLRRLGMQGYFGGLTAGLMLLVGLILAVIGYDAVAEITKSSMRDVVSDVTDSVENEIIHTYRRPVQLITKTLGKSSLTEARNLSERLKYVSVLASVLEGNPNLSGMHVTYDNGDFFAFRRIATEIERRQFNAPADAGYRVRYIINGESSGEMGVIFYDADVTDVGRRVLGPLHAFDPHGTDWYSAAIKTDGMAESDPFLLPPTGPPVIVFARKADNGRAVVAADVLTERFSATLKRLLPTPNATLALIQPDGDILGTALGLTVSDDDGGVRIRGREDLPAISRMAFEAYLQGRRGQDIRLHDGEQDWEVSITEFPFGGSVGDAVILAIPEADLLVDARKFLRFALIGLSGLLLLALPLMWLGVRRVFRPLSRLTEKAGRLAEFDVDDLAGMDSHLAEVHRLALGIRGQREQVRQILDIFRHIGSERDLQRLLSRVVRDVLTIAGVDGGGVALSDGKGDFLSDCTFYWRGEEVKIVPTVPPDRRDPAMAAGFRQAMAGESACQFSILRETSHGRESVLAQGFADPDVARVDEVCIGLRNWTGEILGMLVLCKSARADDPVFQPSQIAFIESLAAAVAVVLETQQLIKVQRDLRDGLIKILAGAIDAKSPYTGGHCERVPVIFQMLLQAACEKGEGPLADFSLDEDGWEEARLAGWLHDCGKVTTPEYVVDKATKLETICDRIHEIRTRFEVLKRDAEIDSLRAVLAGADEEEERKRLGAVLDVLDWEFSFVASCNIGGEDMNEGDMALLEAIGRRSWTRTLDKRLGVSRGERERMDAAGVSGTPARESLLMDNPEHVIPRGEKDTLPADNSWGFRGTAPEALYNRGELYNLRIRRGTLTEEERYKINDHIRQTIIMLESISWPRELRDMPGIAGGHHETMDGRGYPRGLRGDDMGLAARMMAIADIFEALTASDRPYKSSKTLREALEIMDGFKNRNHIDPILYDLFIGAGIPQRYAAGYLKPEQNDL